MHAAAPTGSQGPRLLAGAAFGCWRRHACDLGGTPATCLHCSAGCAGTVCPPAREPALAAAQAALAAAALAAVAAASQEGTACAGRGRDDVRLSPAFWLPGEELHCTPFSRTGHRNGLVRVRIGIGQRTVFRPFLRTATRCGWGARLAAVRRRTAPAIRLAARRLLAGLSVRGLRGGSRA